MPAPTPAERDPARDAPRRIAMVITRSDCIGGAQVHVFELARALIGAGHRVAVFVGGEGPFTDKLHAAGIPTWSLPSLVRPIAPVADGRAIRELLAALRAFAPDLVSTHSTKAGWFGRICARWLSVPVVVTAHGWLLTPGTLSRSQRVAWLAERGLAPWARRIIAVSHYDRSIALEHGVADDRRLRVVHNALPPAESGWLADPKEQPPKLVSVARLDEPKDPLCLIEALAQLRELPWTCELVGDGALRARVESTVRELGLEDRIDMLGTRDDVPERLAGAQIFVLPTRREGFPISILEAMRAGLPVVASDVGGISEAVVSGQTGALVPASDPIALAAALRELLADPDIRAQQGQAGRARFLHEFSFDTHLRRIWAVYCEAIDSGPRSRNPVSR